MTDVLSVISQHTLGKFAGTLVRAGGEGFLGYGYLGMVNKLTGATLAGLSLMQGIGVQNDKRENVKEPDPALKPWKERLVKFATQHGSEMLQTAAVAAGGAALIYAGAKMGGDSLAEGLAEHFAKKGGIKPSDAQFIAVQFLTSTLMTAGDTVAVYGVIKTIQTITSLKLVSNSAVPAKSVEKGEAKAPKAGNAGLDRMFRILSHEAFDIPKAIVISGIGFSAMALGAYFGGQSIQASVAKLMKFI